MINTKRAYYALAALLALIVLSSFATVWLASKWLKSRSESTVALKLEVLGLQQKQQNGQRAQNLLNNYKTEIAAISEVIPNKKDQVDILSQLLQIAEENNVTFGSIVFPSSELGNTPKPAPKTTDETKTAETTATEKETTAATPPKQTITQTKPVEGIPGISSIQIALSNITLKSSNTGLSYDQVLRVLDSIEKNRRTMQMSTISVTPTVDPNTNTLTYQLTINLSIFVKL